MPHNPNAMGYHFPPNTWAVSSFSFSPSLFAILLFLFQLLNIIFFELQPTIQEHEELVLLAGNLKLEVTNYSRELYGPGGVAHLSNGDDDDGGDEEDSEATPSYQPRKRQHH